MLVTSDWIALSYTGYDVYTVYDRLADVGSVTNTLTGNSVWGQCISIPYQKSKSNLMMRRNKKAFPNSQCCYITSYAHAR